MARRARTRLVSLTAFVLTAGCAIGVASGQEGGAAARSFQAGAQAYARNDFRAAAAAFDDAYRMAPRGAAAYNAGLSWERAGEAPRAAQDYSKALVSSDLGAAERADATGRLKALEGRVGRLRIVVPDDAQVSVDETDATELATHLYVAPGRHAVRVQLGNGRTESRSVTIGPGETAEARFASPEVDNQPARPEAPPAAEHPTPSPKTEPDRTMVFVTLGGALVMSVAAIAFYEHGLSVRNQFAQQDTDASLRNQAEAFRALTWVSWGLAGVLAGTGAVLWLTAPSSSAPTALRVGPASMMLDASF
jgi:hypothetical protein